MSVLWHLELEKLQPGCSVRSNAEIESQWWQQIEGVQRTFTSRIWGVQHLDYWQRLKALNLMSMQRRRERYIIIHMWKIWHQRCPNDLGIHFSTPSRHRIKATIPSLSESSNQRQQSLYDGSFAVMGPRLWITIPSDLHLIEDPLLFKAKLSEFLKPFSVNPSVSNYSWNCCFPVFLH